MCGLHDYGAVSDRAPRHHSLRPYPDCVVSGSELLLPYRVLDLTDEVGELAGRILADLGAEVIKVEPPTGDPSRWRPPFFADKPDLQTSLPWWASNLNKRSITLDLEDSTGQAAFRRLVETADFVLESFRPGYLDDLGRWALSLCQRRR